MFYIVIFIWLRTVTVRWDEGLQYQLSNFDEWVTKFIHLYMYFHSVWAIYRTWEYVVSVTRQRRTTGTVKFTEDNYVTSQSNKKHIKMFQSPFRHTSKVPLKSLATCILSVSARYVSAEYYRFFVRRGSSIWCASAWYTEGRRFDPHVQHSVWSWNNFYGHSFPSADSRRAVVNYWQKNVH